MANRFSTASTESTATGHEALAAGYSRSHEEAAANRPDTQPLSVTTIVCIECRRPWLLAAERWRLKVLEGEERETVPYCPDCAAREFGP